MMARCIARIAHFMEYGKGRTDRIAAAIHHREIKLMGRPRWNGKIKESIIGRQRLQGKSLLHRLL